MHMYMYSCVMSVPKTRTWAWLGFSSQGAPVHVRRRRLSLGTTRTVCTDCRLQSPEPDLSKSPISARSRTILSVAACSAVSCVLRFGATQDNFLLPSFKVDRSFWKLQSSVGFRNKGDLPLDLKFEVEYGRGSDR